MLEAQSVKLMLEIIDTFAQKIKIIEKQLEELTKDDEMVKLLLTIRVCGKIRHGLSEHTQKIFQDLQIQRNMQHSVDLYQKLRIQMRRFIMEV